MKITHQTEALMQTTITTGATFRQPHARRNVLWHSARRTLTHLQAAIVKGSDHACWNPAETRASGKETS